MAQGMEAHRDVLRRYNGNNMVKNGSTVADRVLYRDVLLKPNDNHVKGSYGTHANTKSGALNMVKRPNGDTRQKGTWLPKRVAKRMVSVDGEEPWRDAGVLYGGEKKLEDQEAAMGSSGSGGSQATAASEFNDDDSTSGDDDCINHGLGNDNDFEFFNEDLEEENINNENILQKILERMHSEEFPDVSNISPTHVQKIAAEFIMEEEQSRCMPRLSLQDANYIERRFGVGETTKAHQQASHQEYSEKTSFRHTKAKANINDSPGKQEIRFEQVLCPTETVPIRRTTREDLIRANSILNTEILAEDGPGTHDLFRLAKFTLVHACRKHRSKVEQRPRWRFTCHRVIDVFTPVKRNRNGRGFLFVRYSEVSNPKELERKVDNAFIADHKIYANISKYYRNEKKKNETMTTGQGRS
ncbi:hypothetical protein RIF29_17394 [Crotalaria pallida]|uniref:RRM domain-containing protein n=1 Tax=Crotalaria pallida TaxID=3830 RepID=A0AAN9FKF2_CROPI